MPTPILDPDAVAAALDEGTPPGATDIVQLSKAEHARLAALAALAEPLQADRLIGLAIAKALEGRRFADEDARQDAWDILAARLIVRTGEDGKQAVVGRESGRPAIDELAAKVESSSFRRYLAPTSNGGSGARYGAEPAPAPAKPTSFSDHFAAQVLAAKPADHSPTASKYKR